MIGTFAIPGDLNTTSGGYAYDREILRALPGLRHLELPGSFPFPDETALRQTGDLLESADGPLLIDGLALGAMPVSVFDGLDAPIVALCHHPLALETGLGETQIGRLYTSEREALARCAAVIVTSRATADTLGARYGVSADRITVAEPGLSHASAAPRSAEPPILLTAATLIQRKGHDVLIAALEEVRDLPFRAIWAGPAPDPDWHGRLSELIAQADLGDRIEYLGPVSATVLETLRNEASLFCLPSHYEGYGMVFAEAMMSGLPVIGCAGGAVASVVPPSAGLLTEPGDHRAFATSLRAVLTDPILAERLAAGGRAHALSLPGWDETAQIVADVLAEVAR